MGFRERGDEFWDEYFKLTEFYAEKVDLQEPETAREQALEMYLALKEKLSKSF